MTYLHVAKLALNILWKINGNARHLQPVTMTDPAPICTCCASSAKNLPQVRTLINSLEQLTTYNINKPTHPNTVDLQKSIKGLTLIHVNVSRDGHGCDEYLKAYFDVAGRKHFKMSRKTRSSPTGTRSWISQ